MGLRTFELIGKTENKARWFSRNTAGKIFLFLHKV
jgi:hypothetical protein